LINASFGLYAKAIRERELAIGRFGRNRLVVIFSTVVTLLSRHRLLRVELATPRDGKSLYTAMVFIGNNTLQLRGLALSVSDCMKLGMLAALLRKRCS
jgi:hypothetical protein